MSNTATKSPGFMLAVNLFSNKAGLIVRLLLKHPEQTWKGTEIADQLKMKSRWVNCVLDTLESYQFVKREGWGTQSTTKLINPDKLLRHWQTIYRFHHHKVFQYYFPNGDPLNRLEEAADKLGFLWATTGPYAGSLIEKRTTGIPVVYLLVKGHLKAFKALLATLEDIYGFLPVGKGPNIILVQPKDSTGVFYDLQSHHGIPVVSDIQLRLDTAALSEKPT